MSEARPSKPKIFISHSHDDHRLAERLQELLEWASNNGFEIARSSEDGQIKAGTNWYEWIDDQIRNCDVAVVVLTPGSFRGAWVMWEAGACAGVQIARSTPVGSKPERKETERRVQVLGFRLGSERLGPFEREQTTDGLLPKKMTAFVEQLLEDYRPQLDASKLNENFRTLDDRIADFVKGAKQDLRYTPIFASEDIVQEWLSRIDTALEEKDWSWIATARRWVNIAFLGAGNADEHKAIDFRIHSKLATGHEKAQDWSKAIKELQLATELSPNDFPLHIRLGRAMLSTKTSEMREKCSTLLSDLKELDEHAFESDREAITLRGRFLVEGNNWNAVDDLLANVEENLVAGDEYLATWRAIAVMKTHGTDESRRWFNQLESTVGNQQGFWADASRCNALLALDKRDAAKAALERMKLHERPANQVESASRYYDDILTAFGRDIDWRAIASLPPKSPS